MKDDWTRDIQRLMADYRAEAPDGLLDKVKERLAANGMAAPGTTAKDDGRTKPLTRAANGRVIPLWRYRWIAAAAAVAAIAVPVAWKLLPDTKRQVAVVTGSGVDSKGGLRNSHEDTSTLQTVGDATPATTLADATLTNASTGTTHANAGSHSTSAAPHDDDAVMAQAVAGNAAADTGETAKNTDETAENSKGQQPKAKVKVPSRQYYDDLMAYSGYGYNGQDSGSGSRDNGGLALTAYYGGASGGSATGASGQMVMSDAPLHPELNGQDMKHLDAGQTGKAHHRQPIKLGIGVSYRIDRHWSVGTGVTYSYLSSDFTAEGMPKETQHLHYVGIPLAASYSVLRGRRAELYVTGGGEVEKLVKGSMGSDYHESDKLTESRPQWSVKAAVGGAWHFSPTVSVYAEPGFSYHFDNHSDIVNVYKDRPASLSLNIGLRIDVDGQK